jgi:hypothetical protein
VPVCPRTIQQFSEVVKDCPASRLHLPLACSMYIPVGKVLYRAAMLENLCTHDTGVHIFGSGAGCFAGRPTVRWVRRRTRRVTAGTPEAVA